MLELLFFALSAWLDARDLFVAYPALVGLPCALVLLRRRAHGSARARAPASFSPAQRWTIAGLCLLALAYLGLTLVALSPLPGSVGDVIYPTDLMFHISVAAEAKHHWPLQDPLVSGNAFDYHYFFHLHAAAASQVTGIELPVLILRLCLPPLVVLLVLQLALAGRALTGLSWAGPVAAGLGLLAWELDLTISEIAPFLGVNDIWLWASPSYVLGLVFFVPLLALLAGIVDERGRIGDSGRRAGAVALVALLLVGAAGSKVVAVPILAGGLALYLLWRLLSGRGLDRAGAGMLALAVIVFAAAYVLLYSGGEGQLRLALGEIYERMPALTTLEGTVGDSGPARVAFWAAGVIAGTLLHFAPVLIGLLWAVGRGRPLSDPQRLLLCVAAAGLPAWLLVGAENADNNYFTSFGIVAALPLSAAGLCRAFAAWRRGDAVRPGRAAVMLALWLLALVALALVGWEIALDGSPARAYLITYGALALCLLALAARAVRAGSGRREPALALLTLAIVTAAALDPLLDSAPISARSLAEGRKLYVVGGELGLTPAHVEAARWLREETDEDAVIAVSDQRSPASAAFAPLRAEIPALAERRSFHEGWVYSRRGKRFSEVAAGRALPYPERAKLESLVFERASPRALRELVEDYGVGYLVIDREDGPVPPEVYGFGRLVFSNGEVDIIALS